MDECASPCARHGCAVPILRRSPKRYRGGALRGVDREKTTKKAKYLARSGRTKKTINWAVLLPALALTSVTPMLRTVRTVVVMMNNSA